MRMVGRGQLVAKGQPIVVLIGTISREVVGKVVIDETGLHDEYDFKLNWDASGTAANSVDGDSPNGPLTSEPSSAPSLFVALQEQLGLKLESRKAPADVVVVVRVERPSPN